MKRVWLLALLGCGGAPFTSIYADPNALAYGDDARAVRADAEPDVTTESDVSADVALEAGPALSAEAASMPVEASAPVCTPFPDGATGAVSCLDGATPIVQMPRMPDQFVAVNSCGIRWTPPECKCVETYTCACMQAHRACGGAWVSCQMENGSPAVTCGS
jgi:hypothetical protein